MDENHNVIKTGTGFFVTSNGGLLTNNHVISGASYLSARTSSGALFLFEAVIARSEDPDLAVVKFVATDVPYLHLGSSANTVEGQRVLVIGNPEGLQGTVSDGIISAFRGDRSYIQITAPISPGSSGSPVLDESGQVIGMATLVYREGQNLNFAISSETMQAFIASDDAKRQASQATPSQKQQENSAHTSPNIVMDRVVSMVREFVAASSSGSGLPSPSTYYDRQAVYDGKVVTRDFIEQDLQTYYQKWPQRTYSVTSGPFLAGNNDGTFSVTYQLYFMVRNGRRAIQGKADYALIVDPGSGQPVIKMIVEKVLERHSVR
jgi:hypothetical protein